MITYLTIASRVKTFVYTISTNTHATAVARNAHIGAAAAKDETESRIQSRHGCRVAEVQEATGLITRGDIEAHWTIYSNDDVVRRNHIRHWERMLLLVLYCYLFSMLRCFLGCPQQRARSALPSEDLMGCLGCLSVSLLQLWLHQSKNLLTFLHYHSAEKTKSCTSLA